MTAQTMLEKMVGAMQRVPHYGEPGTEDFINYARAALQALREPTAKVREALGYEFANTFTDPLDVVSAEEAGIFQLDPATTEDLWQRPVAELMTEDAVTVFQAAIDAILQELPETTPK